MQGTTKATRRQLPARKIFAFAQGLRAHRKHSRVIATRSLSAWCRSLRGGAAGAGALGGTSSLMHPRALQTERWHGRRVNNNAMPPGCPQTVHHDLFGGIGEVQVSSLLHGESAPFTAVLSCVLAPGGSVGPHVQQDFPELVIGVEGQGDARVNGAMHLLDASHAVYLPLGAALEIMNRSEHHPLRYLIVKARSA